MRRTFLFIIILSFAFSCNTDDAKVIEPPISQEPDDVDYGSIGGNENTPDGLTQISLDISLPEGSFVGENELLVSSLFTNPKPLIEGTVQVDVIDGDGYELAFAEDQEGNVLLLNYINPTKGTSFELSARSTAISMVLMQYWVADLSLESKGELIDFIGSMPEFLTLTNAIESSLAKNGGPLKDEDVLSSLIILIDKAFKPANSGRIVPWITEKEPLTLTANDDGSLIFNNKSSFAYVLMIDRGEQVF